MHNSKKINGFRWKGSCSTVSFFFCTNSTVKNPITCPRLCCSLRDILVACREIGSLSEQVKQKANLRDYNIQSESEV